MDLKIRPMESRDIDALLREFARQGWQKPRAVPENYLTRQQNGGLFVFVADVKGETAGYAVLYPVARGGPFASEGVPEIGDLIVFERFARRGVGSCILNAAERKAGELCERVSLAVGLHSGYGAAQRIYIKRGYIPDGSGVWYRNAPLAQYADCKNDDDLLLYLSLRLRG